MSPPQWFVEHKTHILGLKPVSNPEGEQGLWTPSFLDEQMVEDHVLWLWSLFISVISVAENRHEKLGRECGWLLREFLVSWVLQVVAVFRWGRRLKFCYAVKAFWDIILSKTRMFSDEMAASILEHIFRQHRVPSNLRAFAVLLSTFSQIWMVKVKHIILTDMDIEEVWHLSSLIGYMR